jgi:hypothetical protein
MAQTAADRQGHTTEGYMRRTVLIMAAYALSEFARTSTKGINLVLCEGCYRCAQTEHLMFGAVMAENHM